MYVECPDLFAPTPLDQSKNVTVRSYHKLSKDQNGPKKLKLLDMYVHSMYSLSYYTVCTP